MLHIFKFNSLIKKIGTVLFFLSILSYSLGILRDFILVKNFTNYKDAFLLFYICSLYTLGNRSIYFSENEQRETGIGDIFFQLFLIFIFSIIISIILDNQIKWQYIVISIIWTLNTYLQRSLLLKKKIILSRIRTTLDTVFIILTLSIVILIGKNYQIENVILLSTLITFLTQLIFDSLIESKSYNYIFFEDKNTFLNRLKNFFLSSFGCIIFFYWAAMNTNKNLIIHDINIDIYVRLSFYIFAIFQIFTILVKYFPKKKIVSIILLSLSFMIFLSYYFFMPKLYEFLIVPICCCLIDYSLLILTNKNKKALYEVEI